jgi:hypothetical protein
MIARPTSVMDVAKDLRRRRTMRRSKNATTNGQERGQIRDAVSIEPVMISV